MKAKKDSFYHYKNVSSRFFLTFAKLTSDYGIRTGNKETDEASSRVIADLSEKKEGRDGSIK